MATPAEHLKQQHDYAVDDATEVRAHLDYLRKMLDAADSEVAAGKFEKAQASVKSVMGTALAADRSLRGVRRHLATLITVAEVIGKDWRPDLDAATAAAREAATRKDATRRPTLVLGKPQPAFRPAPEQEK